MREDRVHQFFFCGLEIHRDHVALDQFGNFRADHVRAQQLTCLLVKDDLNQALVFSERDRLPVAHEGKATDPHVQLLFFRCLFGQTD